MNAPEHTSVLLHESIDSLNLSSGDTFLDCTFGAGGHSRYVCEKHKGVHIIAIDEDQQALDKADITGCDIKFMRYNFKDLDFALQEAGVKSVNGILFDLGTSVDQIKSSGRGFTFEKDEPLLMTLQSDSEDTITARDILNFWSAETLETVIRGYGGERYARRIAKAIVDEREEKEIVTTFQLVDIIKRATPGFYHYKKIHPATKTFQAIRIAVNDELNALKVGLRKAYDALAPSGRMSVISFHSLEDREAKRYFRDLEKDGLGTRITKKPVTASPEEIDKNPRSRSAKLRIFEKTT